MVFIINYITRHMRCYIADAVCEVICFKASAQRKPGVLGEETCVTSTAWSSRAGGHGCEPAFLMFEVMAALSAFPAATADNTWGQKRLIWFLWGVKVGFVCGSLWFCLGFCITQTSNHYRLCDHYCLFHTIDEGIRQLLKSPFVHCHTDTKRLVC